MATFWFKMAELRLVFCYLISLSFFLSVCSGYFVNVDAHNVECFFDKVTTGMKMSLTFEVVEGGFLDIDVEVCTCTVSLSVAIVSSYTDHWTRR